MKRDLSSRLPNHHAELGSASLKRLRKLWKTVTAKRPLSAATKNRLALLAGFQSWSDLDDALHGEADAGTNYK